MDQARLVARQIGARLRAARAAAGLTLQQLGDQAGLSAAFLSRVERGEATPSIANLIAVAQRLAMPLRDLFEDEVPQAPQGYAVSRLNARAAAEQIQAAGYRFHWLSGDLPQPRLSAFLLEFPVTTDPSATLLEHEGEEILYLLEGSLEFRIGEDVLVLAPGDCVHLLGDRPHMGRNIGTVPARLLMVVTPPGAVHQP
ncbi:XRE family transcriptional regulator [Rhodovarius crocodyli]|uniref:XRE family transcriptional regulator n=1 Tax=Rhodovarius crocodyli TaxID=1979269 RepID=A0A437MGQ9_9PROT|nr:XRE family transcriptional regulator [Rhodovarius crocodyli]RVT96802.1 XRE family transcriptional regulator [Rhodovarius crocodyli]